MNIFDLAKISPRRGITIDRLERIKREGSPVYNYNLAATAAGAVVVIDVENQFPQARKYFPLDSLEIVNAEAAIDLLVTLNENDQRYCPASTIRTINGTGVALRRLTITNLHAADTTTLGKVRLAFQREPMTIDRWSQLV